MCIGWLTCIPAVLLTHSPLSFRDSECSANRQMPIASVVSGQAKKTTLKQKRMEFIKRLFKKNVKLGDSWTMFSTSKSEVTELLISNGKLTIGDDFLKIENYPFEPSIAYRQTIFRTNQIDDIDFKSYPPTFKVGSELIYLTSEKKVELEEFARKNKIKTVERPAIWGWVLEPFLDTEFTTETDIKLTKRLEDYGLSAEQVKILRAEVETQMLKYNFDTTLLNGKGLTLLTFLEQCGQNTKRTSLKTFINE